MGLLLAACLLGCSSNPAGIDSIGKTGDSDPSQGEEVADKRAMLVGAQPPCSSGWHGIDSDQYRRFDYKTKRDSEDDKGLFLYEIGGMTKFCNSLSDEQLATASAQVIANNPGLCEGLKPRNYRAHYAVSWETGFGDWPEELKDSAIANWVKQTNGGAAGGVGVDEDGVDTSVLTRYQEAHTAVQVAAVAFCP